MSIDVRKFINVNIDYADQVGVISQRDTAVLITSEGVAGEKTLISSLSQWQEYIVGKVFTTTTPYVNVFFAHGGSKLLVVEASTFADTIATLEDRYIVVAVVGQTMSTAKTNAITLDTREGVKRKILLARATNADLSPVGESLPAANALGINSLAIKYSEVVGAEMTMAAYLTRVNINGNNTVFDYAFTSENIAINTSPAIDDTLFDVLMGFNLNFNIPLAGVTRNVGGNMSSGRPLINEFMLIVLHQTVTDELLILLTSKIKGNQALSAIRAIITQELNRYITNGYLDTNKIWVNEDWVVTHNAQSFTIITQGTPITLGYWIQVLPWSALDASDRAERKAPPIYLVLADSYGVRKIEVNGKVI